MKDETKLKGWKEAHGVKFGLDDKCNAQLAVTNHVMSQQQNQS